MSSSHPQTVVRSVCPLDCPDTCGLAVTLKEGRIVRVDGDPDHPITRGTICHKARHFPSRVYHPDRVLHPLKRTGRKGEGVFTRITWEEALDEITRRMQEIIRRYGAEAILPYSYYGNMGLVNNGSMDRRFFHRLGASRLDRTICNVAGNRGFEMTMGFKGAIDPEETVHSRLIIVWGGNIVSTNMHQVMLFEQARKRGAKIVAIDVHRNRTARWADEFIQLYPGTDAALALAMMHTLIEEDLLDHDFIRTYTTGWEEFRKRIAEYPPERASRITGVRGGGGSSAWPGNTERPPLPSSGSATDSAPRQRRDDRPHHRLPPRPDRAVEGARGRRPQGKRGRRRRQGEAGAPRSPAGSRRSDHQHDSPGRRPVPRRSAHPLPLCIQRQSGPGGSCPGERCSRDWPGRTCSPWCTICSSPTRPGLPTWSCRPHPILKTWMSTNPTGTCTFSWPVRSFRRRERPCPTSISSKPWPSGWASPNPVSTTRRRTSSARLRTSPKIPGWKT